MAFVLINLTGFKSLEAWQKFVLFDQQDCESLGGSENIVLRGCQSLYFLVVGKGRWLKLLLYRIRINRIFFLQVQLAMKINSVCVLTISQLLQMLKAYFYFKIFFLKTFSKRHIHDFIKSNLNPQVIIAIVHVLLYWIILFFKWKQIRSLLFKLYCV